MVVTVYVSVLGLWKCRGMPHIASSSGCRIMWFYPVNGQNSEIMLGSFIIIPVNAYLTVFQSCSSV